LLDAAAIGLLFGRLMLLHDGLAQWYGTNSLCCERFCMPARPLFGKLLILNRVWVLCGDAVSKHMQWSARKLKVGALVGGCFVWSI